MAINDLLRSLKRLVFLVETTLDNTHVQPHAMDDALAGFVPFTGHDNSVKYTTNAHVLISNDVVLDLETALVMESGFSKRSTYPAANDDVFISRSFANILLSSKATRDHLLQRKFKGKDVTVKVGGLVNEGKAGEKLLRFDEYEVLVKGKFTSYGMSEEGSDLSIGMDSSDLEAVFPKAVYQEGALAGRAKPFGVGRYYGYKFPVLRDGFGQFHDGVVDTQDIIRDDIQVVYDGYGIHFHQNFGFADGYIKDTSGFASYDLDDHSFADESETSVTFSGGFNGTFSIKGEGVHLTADDHGVTLVQDAATNLSTYVADDFRWVVKDSFHVESVSEYPVTVTVTSALEIFSVGGRWFKITDISGSSVGGTITFDFGSVVGELDLIVRQQDLAGIDNWSIAPDSLTPEDDSGENYIAHFDALNATSLSLDFARPTPSDLVAFWFRKIVFYAANPVEISIEFDREAAVLELVANTGIGSLGFENFSVQPDTVPDAGINTDTIDFDRAGFDKLKFTYLSGFGSAYFAFNKLVDDESDYGARRVGDLIVLKPPPVSLALVEGYPTLCSAELLADSDDPMFTGRVFGNQWRQQVRARLKSKVIGSVSMFIGTGPFNYDLISVTPNWQTFELEVGAVANGSPEYASAEVWRGTSTTNLGTLSATNPDIDFEVEIEVFSCMPVWRYPAAISVYDRTATQRIPHLSYRVTDASKFGGMPPGVVVYDARGHLAFWEGYNDQDGDFVGYKAEPDAIEAFQTISELAKGINLVSADFVGEKVGFVMDQQTQWVDHVALQCQGLNYLVSENEDTDGITIYRRADIFNPATDFLITVDDIVEGSIGWQDGDPREYRYIVEYLVNLSDPSKTPTKKSRFGYRGDLPERSINTPLVDPNDAESRAEAIVLDSLYNDRLQLTLLGIGWNLRSGMVGQVQHPAVPRALMYLVEDVGFSDEMETPLTLKVFRV